MSAEEIVGLYLANGYDGVVITDHFLNGNTTVNSERPNGSYAEKIEMFFQGYEGVKRAAKGKLKSSSALNFPIKARISSPTVSIKRA